MLYLLAHHVSQGLQKALPTSTGCVRGPVVGVFVAGVCPARIRVSCCNVYGLLLLQGMSAQLLHWQTGRVQPHEVCASWSLSNLDHEVWLLLWHKKPVGKV
jgi:hypothetical protein